MLFFVLLFVTSLFGIGDELEIVVDQSSPNSSNNSTCWTRSSCSSFDLGIEGINNFQSSKGFKVLSIKEGSYFFTNNKTGHFNNTADITIQGVSTKRKNSSSPVIISCVGKVGLTFLNSRNITLSRVTFSNCGQSQISTSENFTTRQFITVVVSLYFLYCRNIHLEFVVVQNTNGTGIIFYNVIGENKIKNCTFSRNVFSGEPGGGGVYLEYSFCEPKMNSECHASSKSDVNTLFTRNGNFFIQDSKFIDNKANFSAEDIYIHTFMVPANGSHSAFGCGGGLSLFFMGKASSNNIEIENCDFIGNSALWGGGVLTQFQDYSSNNTVKIYNSKFVNNQALFEYADHSDGTGGGGSRVAMLFFDNDNQSLCNSVFYTGCVFHHNSAYYGGGVSFYSNPIRCMNASIRFKECQFLRNQASVGSSIDLTITQWVTSLHGSKGSTPFALIFNCNFTCNSPLVNGLTGIGAVNLNGINAHINGYANFFSNAGSAMSIAESYLFIKENSIISFVGNHGRNGGAMAIFGKSFISVSENSTFNFTNNSADYYGGAIYHTSLGLYDFIYSRDCFIKYHKPSVRPDEWIANFVFINNTADNTDNSIYSSTLMPCLRDISFMDRSRKGYNELFCSNKRWKFNNDTEHNCSSHIATAPSIFQNVSAKYEVVPGKLPIKINFSFVKDMSQAKVDQKAAVIVRPNQHKRKSKFQHSNEGFTYISHNDLYLLGEENTSISIMMETLDPIVAKTSLNIEFQRCPPGFKFNEKELNCVCAGTYKNKVTCDEKKFQATIDRASWIGPKNINEGKNSTLFAAFSPYTKKATSNYSIILPSSFSLDKLNNLLCGQTNREGVLCGECKHGYGVSVNTKEYECVECNEANSKINWCYYILTEFFPVTMFFIVLYLFSMTVTFGPLISYIFFAQMVTTVVEINAHGLIPMEKTLHQYRIFKEIYTIPYDFWNLNFFRSAVPGFCLSTRLGTLDVHALGYITAVYPLILVSFFMLILNLYNRGMQPIVIIVRPFHLCLAKFKQITNLRQSITGGIAVFIVISYNKFAFVSFNLIPVNHLYDAEGRRNESVFYFQGSLNFPKEGISYIVTSVVVLCTFVAIPPAVLAYPSILKAFERIEFFRSRFMIERLYPGPKLQAFLNKFHGCYRDGSGGGIDCRWFSSLYFILRVILMTAYSFLDSWQQVYLMQGIVFLFIALVFAIIRPYTEDWINNVDTCMFAILSASSTISLYNLQLAKLQKEIDVTSFGLQYGLMMLPLIYCLGYFTVLFYKQVKPKFHEFLIQRRVVNVNERSNYNEEDQNVEDSTYMARFFDFICGSGRCSHNHRGPNVVSQSINSDHNVVHYYGSTES